jgi:carboxyl-terminal processing protease
MKPMGFFEKQGRALTFSITGTVLLLIGAFGAGIYVGFSNRPQVEQVSELFNKETGKPADVDFEPFWKAWNLISERYVSQNGPDAEMRVWGAIQGLAASLGDPYTTFFPPEELKEFEENISGNFEGVGMEIGMRDGVLTVIAPLKGTPAERAGVRSGDRIIAISGTSTASLSLDSAVRLIRGEKGSKVTLTVVREGNDKPLDLEVIRDIIEVPTLESEVKTASSEGGGSGGVLKDGVFVIRLFNFTAHAPTHFEKALRDFEQSGSDKLVIDVRGNPGGFLNGAVEIASWFLPAGKVIVREDYGANEEEKVHRSRGYDYARRAGKPIDIVILIDGGSASASEILAGALREHGVAMLVGEKSFGKGSVQELIPVTNSSSLKLTIARWLTPEGVSISEGGLSPDIEVKITEEDVETKRDPQLDKAIEILTK